MNKTAVSLRINSMGTLDQQDFRYAGLRRLAKAIPALPLSDPPSSRFPPRHRRPPNTRSSPRFHHLLFRPIPLSFGEIRNRLLAVLQVGARRQRSPTKSLAGLIFFSYYWAHENL